MHEDNNEARAARLARCGRSDGHHPGADGDARRGVLSAAAAAGIISPHHHRAMSRDTIEEQVQRELRRIEDEHDPADWGYVEPGRMEAEDAYARGYHDALRFVATLLSLQD
jgi:hypothetical protein